MANLQLGFKILCLLILSCILISYISTGLTNLFDEDPKKFSIVGFLFGLVVLILPFIYICIY